MNEKISENNWNLMYRVDSVDDKTEIFYNNYLGSLDAVAPVKDNNQIKNGLITK